jgi:hypothetical protein
MKLLVRFSQLNTLRDKSLHFPQIHMRIVLKRFLIIKVTIIKLIIHLKFQFIVMNVIEFSSIRSALEDI